MLSRLVIGTLSTLNTFMSPLAGNQEHGILYHLEAASGGSRSKGCPTARPSQLGLRILPGPQTHMTVAVDGQICSKPVSFSIVVPDNLLDEHFLEELPIDTAYIVSGVPMQVSGGGARARIKITRRTETSAGLTPIDVEWLPSAGVPERGPMTIWMRKTPGRLSAIPWQRVEFSEIEKLAGSLPLNLAIAPEPPAEKKPRTRTSL